MSIGNLHCLPLPDHHRYGSPAAHLYHLIDVESGIRVNGRLAKLIIARESGCLVSWQTGRKTGGYGKDGKSQPYEPMVEVPLSSVEPARALGESEARRR